MKHLILPLIGWSGVASLIFRPDPQFWVMLGVLVTGLVNIILSHMSSKREQRRREWETEDREANREMLLHNINTVADLTRQTKADIRDDIAHNTALTIESSRKADVAFDTANHANEKIANLAAAVVNREASDELAG